MSSSASDSAGGIQMDVTVPEDVGPGSVLGVKAPNGTDLQVTVPEGASPGGHLMVDVGTGEAKVLEPLVAGAPPGSPRAHPLLPVPADVPPQLAGIDGDTRTHGH